MSTSLPLDFDHAFPNQHLDWLVAESLYAEAVEYFFACPYCWEQISMVLDLSVRGQTYVEDCEVCCRPIEVSYSIEGGEVAGFEANVLD